MEKVCQISSEWREFDRRDYKIILVSFFPDHAVYNGIEH